RCFLHIINLACQAVLEAITDTPHIEYDAADFIPKGPTPRSFTDAINRDPISTLRSLIHYFASVLRMMGQSNLQLIRDVKTRCDPKHLWVIPQHLNPCSQFLESSDNEDMHKFRLNDIEWEALEAFHLILQVPHAFQQVLSYESTPTLGHTVPAYEAMENAWKQLQAQNTQLSGIIQCGLGKLDQYRTRADRVPAYVLAMGKIAIA
ncbi:hypothetical protein WOLCODRAFT_68329, partial [Wolfiporia cocos MD-104 SS10]